MTTVAGLTHTARHFSYKSAENCFLQNSNSCSFFLFQDEYRAKFDLSSDVDVSNVTVEKTSKKRKRSENDDGKKKKIKRDEKNKKAAGLIAQEKKDKKVRSLSVI